MLHKNRWRDIFSSAINQSMTDFSQTKTTHIFCCWNACSWDTVISWLTPPPHPYSPFPSPSPLPLPPHHPLHLVSMAPWNWNIIRQFCPYVPTYTHVFAHQQTYIMCNRTSLIFDHFSPNFFPHLLPKKVSVGKHVNLLGVGAWFSWQLFFSIIRQI